jgi:3-deoxy-D-manno-octulosonate 8-phosphate phosphatase (KDO 8-P phosphatase)
MIMKKFKNLILDVDGVFTDGKFHYTEQGKTFKTFGDADNDALSLIRDHMHIEMVSGDKRGFGITKKRIHDDMGYPLSMVSTFERKAWIQKRFDLSETIYMGDGLYDVLVFDVVGFSIAPANAFPNTKSQANLVTSARGGEGAVAEACIYIMENFLDMDFNTVVRGKITSSGIWNNSAIIDSTPEMDKKSRG